MQSYNEEEFRNYDETIDDDYVPPPPPPKRVRRRG